jgi:ABC-type ATPase involved in cell division
VAQIEAAFDVPPSERARLEWTVDLPIEDRPWSVGLIVGPSGSGKSTVARDVFDAHICEEFAWKDGSALVDSFDDALDTSRITDALGRVGLSTTPAWLRPFNTLSNGEQFRATMARTLLEGGELVVVDEFTSVVDRQVARVASHTTQKWVRRETGRQFVAVSCHYDIVDWLRPDWILDMATTRFEWRSVQPRPRLRIEVRRARRARAAWRLFARHHYMTHVLHPAAQSFVAVIDGSPVAFNSYIHFPHPRTKNIKRGHRLVVLPEWQGLGIGPWFADWMGEHLHARGFRYHTTTASPTMIRARLRSPRWRALVTSSMKSGPRANRSLARVAASRRRLSTTTFAYSPRKK